MVKSSVRFRQLCLEERIRVLDVIYTVHIFLDAYEQLLYIALIFRINELLSIVEDSRPSVQVFGDEH